MKRRRGARPSPACARSPGLEYARPSSAYAFSNGEPTVVMALIGSTDGKGGLRVRRSKKSGLVREAHELEVTAMLIGGFDAMFVQHEDVAVVPTDTIENIIGV